MRRSRMVAVLVAVVVAVVVATVAAVGVSPAGAHVTVHPGKEKKGATDVLLTFAVPNEEDSASTTRLELTLPTAAPLLGVHAQAIPGWTATVETTKLAEPVTTDDGTVTRVASKVTWTVNDPADAVGPDQFGAFTVLVGALPRGAPKVVFKVAQTYSDGTVVSWIQVPVKGTPEPAHPAPVLRLVGKA